MHFKDSSNVHYAHDFFGIKFPVYLTLRMPIVIDEPTPCDEVTRIVFRNIEHELSRQLTVQTAQQVSLDKMFSLLLIDKIEPYMKGLPAETRSTCYRTISMLRWLKGDEVEGFDYAKYYINEGLRELLAGVATTLAGLQWERRRLTISIVGYTDQKEVSGIALEPEKTGVADWREIREPLKVYYGGCTGDKIGSKRPVLVPMGTAGGKPVGRKIDDNCELGAVRAYVATAFVMNMLGREGV